MENPTLDDTMEGAGIAEAPRGLVSASCSQGSSGSGSPLGSTPATAARQRKPGRWKRFPRVVPPTPSEHALKFPNAQPPPEERRSLRPFCRRFGPFSPLRRWRQRRRHRSPKKLSRWYMHGKGPGSMMRRWSGAIRRCWNMRNNKQLEEAEDDDDWDEEARAKFCAFKAKFVPFYRRLASTRPEDVVFKSEPPSDTPEEHLSAEEMEMEADRSGWLVCPQACHFATLALEHYNSSKKTNKFEMTKVLLSKCFSEADGKTFAHVNFTAATPRQSASHPVKRLFFAELMLIPDLQAYDCIEPMRVLHECTIDDSCFGGCHEMMRDIKGPVSKDMDYDRCYACSQRIKHPRDAQFIAGHNRTDAICQRISVKTQFQRIEKETKLNRIFTRYQG